MKYLIIVLGTVAGALFGDLLTESRTPASAVVLTTLEFSLNDAGAPELHLVTKPAKNCQHKADTFMEAKRVNANPVAALCLETDRTHSIRLVNDASGRLTVGTHHPVVWPVSSRVYDEQLEREIGISGGKKFLLDSRGYAVSPPCDFIRKEPLLRGLWLCESTTGAQVLDPFFNRKLGPVIDYAFFHSDSLMGTIDGKPTYIPLPKDTAKAMGLGSQIDGF